MHGALAALFVRVSFCHSEPPDVGGEESLLPSHSLRMQYKSKSEHEGHEGNKKGHEISGWS